MSQISELQMSVAFEKLLKSDMHVNSMPKFNLLYKEIVCQQGIADFIGIKYEKEMDQFSFLNNIISLESGTLLLSLLKYKAPRSEKYLLEKTGLSEKTINRVIKELLDNDIIQNISEKTYVISSNLVIPEFDIWAFELKLSNWKRALFQALQYKAFANYSSIVVPIEKEYLLSKQLSLFKKLNVGIILFDYDNNKIRFLVRPKKEKSTSKWHRFYAIGKLANQCNTNNTLNYKTEL